VVTPPWAEHEVAVRRADRKTMVHPRVGSVLLDCETLVTPDQGQQLLVLTPADAEARERLELLRVLGIEEFPTGSDDALAEPATAGAARGQVSLGS
jgi:transcription regulator MmyB-like protein